MLQHAAVDGKFTFKLSGQTSQLFAEICLVFRY
jgi:hypothetical protein